ncbi:tryptophan synthase subunit alpha [Oenococcus sp. UCMA 17063]|nr:tryptophan synthase subunit alpha [Oenococcus sp. UCMA 17063]
MNRLTGAFKKHKAFISFVVAGDPDFQATVDHVVTLAKAGSDIVELGIPFSDPIADGPEIQAADLRAFKKGITTEKVFELVTEIRKQTQIPLVFLTYLNIVFKYGYEAFIDRCAQVGVDGLIIPDLPLEERAELLIHSNKKQVALIPLVAPTTSAVRLKQIVKQASGFIYVVSSMGVTGVRNDFNQRLRTLVGEIEQETDLPTAIGFGVHEPQQAFAMTQFADGVICGSAIVHQIHYKGGDVDQNLSAYVHLMRSAIDQPPKQTFDGQK